MDVNNQYTYVAPFLDPRGMGMGGIRNWEEHRFPSVQPLKMDVLPTSMSVRDVYASCPWRPEESLVFELSLNGNGSC